MTVAVAADGTQNAVIGTTHTLATVAGPKTCVLVVDLTNLAAGDTVEIKAHLQTLSGSTAAAVTTTTITGPQADPVAMSIPYPAAHSAAFSLKQTTGVGRAFPWSVLTLD